MLSVEERPITLILHHGLDPAKSYVETVETFDKAAVAMRTAMRNGFTLITLQTDETYG